MEIFLSLTLLSAIIFNISLYFFRKKSLEKQKKEKYLSAGVYIRRIITNHFSKDPILIFDLGFFNAIWTFGLGCISGAGILIFMVEIVTLEPIFLSHPTILAKWINSFNFSPTVFVVVVGLILIPLLWNIFYLTFKIAPLFSRFSLEYKNNSLQFFKRFGKKELVKVNFKEPYLYEETIDYWGMPWPYTTPVSVHIFAQNGKAIAITKDFGELHTAASIKKKQNLISNIRLLSKVDIIYQMVVEDSFEEEFVKIIKKWRK